MGLSKRRTDGGPRESEDLLADPCVLHREVWRAYREVRDGSRGLGCAAGRELDREASGDGHPESAGRNQASELFQGAGGRRWRRWWVAKYPHHRAEGRTGGSPLTHSPNRGAE
jgi:hypothetical protein